MAHSASKSSYENWSTSLTWPINILFSSIWPQDILMLVVEKESNLKLFQFRFSVKARYKCGWLIEFPYRVEKMINVVIPKQIEQLSWLSLLPKLLIIGLWAETKEIVDGSWLSSAKKSRETHYLYILLIICLGIGKRGLVSVFK